MPCAVNRFGQHLDGALVTHVAERLHRGSLDAAVSVVQGGEERVADRRVNGRVPRTPRVEAADHLRRTRAQFGAATPEQRREVRLR